MTTPDTLERAVLTPRVVLKVTKFPVLAGQLPTYASAANTWSKGTIHEGRSKVCSSDADYGNEAEGVGAM